MIPDQMRRLRAKRFNEHMKLIANGFNTVAAGSLAGAAIVPAANATHGQPIEIHWSWIAASIVYHLRAQAALRFLPSEE